MNTTKIAGRDIPIKPGEHSTLVFAGDRTGEYREPKSFEFWTLVGQGWRDTARQNAGNDPGERWRRMVGEPGYEKSVELSKFARHLRPATAEEVESWLNTHLDDARHLRSCVIGSRTMTFSGPPYRLEVQE